MTVALDDVRKFWNDKPCQSDLSQAEDRRRYFQEISDRRYGGREKHVPIVAEFSKFRGKSVVEIGCGFATDGLEFAKNGANYTGVDLTPQAIELAKERFNLFGVPGRFVAANAEQGLPFADESVDHIYSFGVIHHAPYPERIAHEMHRILKKGGTFTVMLYNRNSINYYIEIMFLRKVFRALLRPKFMPSFLSSLTGFDRAKLEGHREILVKSRKLTKEQWISMNTDGPFCPLARVYDGREASELFKEFTPVRQDVWEFNVEHWSFLGNLIPDSIAHWMGRKWGWHRLIYGVKH